jgi:dTDP-4-amino-4,6-dideoxygalactose transaminase
MSGNYRLGEFAGAVLNCQLDRLDEQTDRRDANGRYLDSALSKVPGITPQRRDAFATRNAQHLYLFRYDAKVFGVPRERFLQALEAEAIPASPGYVLPLYKQPLFANRNFGPYAPSCTTNFGELKLPNVEAICGGEGAWLYQSVLLGSTRDMDDVVAAFQKVYDRRHDLAADVKVVAAGAAK